RGAGAQIVTVRSVDYEHALIHVYNSNGPRVARMLKPKASGTTAGSINLPNVDEIGVIIPLNGDAKSCAWIGSLNSIETSRTLERDENYVSTEDLVHRVYHKHESGTFSILDRLGKFIASFKKKAAEESDEPKKNVDVSLTNDGILNVKHYRGDDKVSVEFSSNQDGAVSFTLFKDDGTTPAVTVSSDKDGNVTKTVEGDLQETIKGDEAVEISKGLTVNTQNDAVINGGQELAFKSALESLKSQLDEFKTLYNLHTHANTKPGS
ncbi:MAG: hypothetical protein GTN64_08720, partial [Candidatus Latescibacteria bacterium]|nr:hypothetical protein [Candidatus Latescibacterota bacterium]NIO78682.1 hypothetical protein [Candidatus Latescibacterota bacterium]